MRGTTGSSVLVPVFPMNLPGVHLAQTDCAVRLLYEPEGHAKQDAMPLPVGDGWYVPTGLQFMRTCCDRNAGCNLIRQSGR